MGISILLHVGHAIVRLPNRFITDGVPELFEANWQSCKALLLVATHHWVAIRKMDLPGNAAASLMLGPGTMGTVVNGYLVTTRSLGSLLMPPAMRVEPHFLMPFDGPGDQLLDVPAI